MGEPTPSFPAARAWRWVPTLYFCEGLPYVAVVTVSVVLFKSLGISNTDTAYYTSWLYLPWVIKPLWSPVVDLTGTKRAWVLAMQFLIGVALAAAAAALAAPFFWQATLAVFWVLAFSSATHDIAADGFYLLALPAHQQAAFVGVRSTFYRIAMVAGGGGLVYLAGRLEAPLADPARAWSVAFAAGAAVFLAAAVYHFFALPRPAADGRAAVVRTIAGDFLAVFAAFFRKKDLGLILAFLLVYRLGEAQLLKLVPPFLLDGRAAGGLGLTTSDVGVLYGTIGVTALIAGGLVGGYAISRRGLKRMLWPMLIGMHLPIVAFIALAAAQPASLVVIGAALTVEQFGYGFGFTAYMVYMMLVADGPHRTSHYAICTGFMALGMMLPGMPAGWIQEQIGYANFFIWVCLSTIPSFVVAALVRIDPQYGRKA